MSKLPTHEATQCSKNAHMGLLVTQAHVMDGSQETACCGETIEANWAALTFKQVHIENSEHAEDTQHTTKHSTAAKYHGLYYTM